MVKRNNFVRYNNMSRTGYNASPYNNMGYGMMSFRRRGNRGGFRMGVIGFSMGLAPCICGEEEPVICYIDGYVNIHI